MTLRTIAKALVVGMITALVSCNLDTDDNYSSFVEYDDAAVVNMTFGTLYQNIPNDTDTIVKVKSYAGSGYAIQIDQKKREIYNYIDSLPLYTDLKRITLNPSTVNSGIFAMWDDSLKMYLPVSSSVEFDFTQQREFFVFSANGAAKNKYRMSVVAHQENGDSVSWGNAHEIEVLKGLTGIKAVSFGDKVYVLGDRNGHGALIVCDPEGAAQWSVSTSIAPSAHSCMVAGRTHLYVLDKENGQISYTTDGDTWTTTACDGADRIKSLAGVIDFDKESQKSPAIVKLYALTLDNKIIESEDNGGSWNTCKTDADASLMPSMNISDCWQSVGSDMERVYMIGTREGDDNAVIWSKLYDSDVREQEPWINMTVAEERPYKLPALTDLSVASYGDYMLAIGASGHDGVEAYSEVYSSVDHGITWKKKAPFVLPEKVYIASPEELNASESGVARATDVEIVADSRNMLWVICGGSGLVWRGRLNKMTWKDYKKSFK